MESENAGNAIGTRSDLKDRLAVDIRYALGQLRGISDEMDMEGMATDRAQRAIDALERIEEELKSAAFQDKVNQIRHGG